MRTVRGQTRNNCASPSRARGQMPPDREDPPPICHHLLKMPAMLAVFPSLFLSSSCYPDSKIWLYHSPRGHVKPVEQSST
jgi:hypothetical protein